MLPNLKAITATLGALLMFLSAGLLVPMIVGLIYAEPEWWTFGATAVLSGAVGFAAWRGLGGLPPDLSIRDGFAIVALSWLVLSVVGALPFVLGGVLESYTDAFFETMSGFTTTGATILGGATNPEIEEIPNAFLFWRSLTHWIGGMGIIVLTLAVLPILGVGGMQLFKAEVPGPTADKLTPRVRETARRLWYIYVGITAAEVLLLLPAMSLFDSINHAFATMATGGFSTENGSVGQYASPYVEWVVTAFMFLAGTNFALHYRILNRTAGSVARDTEYRVYVGIIVAATILVTIGTWQTTVSWLPWVEREAAAFEGYPHVFDALRTAAFQVVSIVTTTGFATADYEIWPPLGAGVIFLLFFCGGMAASTGGGVKVIRHVLMFKNSFREIRQLIHPAAVIPVRLNGEVVPRDILSNVLSFIVLYIGGIGLGTAVLFVVGIDLLSAFGASMSSIGNIGPAFGTFGPTENYAHVPAFGKWALSLLMMAGRLELFTVLILFAPAYWKR
jgi:trk system potassium uptake protein TrkH